MTFCLFLNKQQGVRQIFASSGGEEQKKLIKKKWSGFAKEFDSKKKKGLASEGASIKVGPPPKDHPFFKETDPKDPTIYIDIIYIYCALSPPNNQQPHSGG